MFLFFFSCCLPSTPHWLLCPKRIHFLSAQKPAMVSKVSGNSDFFYWCRPVHSFWQLLALPMPRADPEQSSLQNAGCATSNTQLLQRLVESWYLIIGIENQKKTIQHKLHDGMAMSQMRWGRCLFLSKCQQGAINFILLVTHLHYGNLNELISVTSGLHYSQEYR